MNIADYVRMGRARGWGYPYRYFLESHWFDLVRGVDTHYWVPPTQYVGLCPSGRGDSVHYVACPTTIIRAGLADVRRHAETGFSQLQLFDLGCGKGKALLVYGEMLGAEPRPIAVGIEHVAELADIARANMVRRGLDGETSIVTGDAAEWCNHVQADGVIIFLYNPFGAATLRKVLAGCFASRAYIIYVDPEHHGLVQSLGWVQITSRSGRYKNDNARVYWKAVK